MGLGNNPGDNRPKDEGRNNEKGEGANNQPADSSQSSGFEGASLPDFGKKIGEAHYVLSAGDEVVSAGNVDLHTKGLVGEQVIDRDTLKILGVKDEDGAFRALVGDNGPGKTSVGYSPKFAKGWDRLFGQKPSNN